LSSTFSSLDSGRRSYEKRGELKGFENIGRYRRASLNEYSPFLRLLIAVPRQHGPSRKFLKIFSDAGMEFIVPQAIFAISQFTARPQMRNLSGSEFL
jgi:hypothetical protein